MAAQTTAPVLLRAALAGLLFCVLPLSAQEAAVVGVLSRDTIPYRDAATGMRNALIAKGSTVRTVTLNASGALTPGQKPVRGTMLVTFGQRAGELFAREASSTMVSCMTVEPMARTSVVLQHTAEARMERVRRLLPRAATFGILVARDNGVEPEVREFQTAARRAGVKLVRHTVDLRRPLGPQLEQLSDRIDVLMATYDLRIFSAEHAQPIMLFSYRHRIPVIGVSDAWSRAGAILSFDWDYHDIGHQCGEHALRLMEAGSPPDKHIVETPRRIMYSLNLEAARYFQIEPAPELLQGARQKFN